jgi:hypothetical protein
MRRGLSRPDHVKAMHGYCPLCYRGQIGVSGTEFVPEKDAGDERLDREQLALSRKGNGLPALDMTSPGERCESAVMCRVVCLVCGQSMLDGDDPDFEALVEIMDELEGMHLEFEEEVANCGLEQLVKGMEQDVAKKSARALREYNLSWVGHWGRPIHAHCAQTAPCGCVVHVGAAACVKHGRHIPQRRAPAGPKKRGSSPPAPIMSSSSREEEDHHPAILSVKHRVPSGVGVVTGTGTLAKRATWLPHATDMATTDSQVPTTTTTATSKFIMMKRKAGPPPAPPKAPYAHTTRGKMLKAASTCHRLDGWVSSSGRLTPGTNTMATTSSSSGQADGKKYDLRRHNSTYDPFVHGPFRKNGEYWFLRPDGKAVRAQEGVCEFNEQGELEPR